MISIFIARTSPPSLSLLIAQLVIIILGLVFGNSFDILYDPDCAYLFWNIHAYALSVRLACSILLAYYYVHWFCNIRVSMFSYLWKQNAAEKLPLTLASWPLMDKNEIFHWQTVGKSKKTTANQNLPRGGKQSLGKESQKQTFLLEKVILSVFW